MRNIGMIDYYLDEWHANNYPKWIEELSGGDAKVTCACALMNSPHKNGRTTAQWGADMGVPILTMDEVIARSDALIVLSPDHCHLHEIICHEPLKSGKPTFVDKTFAPDAATARRIFAHADAYHTPCFSSSALRYADEYQDQGRIDTLCSWGPGNYDIYSVHQIEPMMMLMRGEPKRVMAIQSAQRTLLIVEFADGRLATINTLGEGSFLMHLSGEKGRRMVEPKSDYFKAFIRVFLRFAETKEAPVRPEDTIAIMAVREAGLHALANPGVWLSVFA